MPAAWPRARARLLLAAVLPLPRTKYIKQYLEESVLYAAPVTLALASLSARDKRCSSFDGPKSATTDTGARGGGAWRARRLGDGTGVHRRARADMECTFFLFQFVAR